MVRVWLQLSAVVLAVLVWRTWATEESVSLHDPRHRRCGECMNNAALINKTIEDNNAAVGNATDAKAAIDWRQVEENFNKVLTEDEVFLKWDAMEANMRSGIRALLRSVFPKVVSLSSDAKVSGNCAAGLLKWVVSLRHMKVWALKMLDAFGKPPSGMFEGVVSMFGNYDQCLKLRVFHDDDEHDEVTAHTTDAVHEPKEFFRGQYCVAEFKPWLPKKPRFYGMNTVLKTPFQEENSAFTEFSKMSVFFHFISFRMDLCVPSTCTRDDIQRVADLMANLAEIRARVVRCEVDDGTSPLWTGHFVTFSLAVVVLVVVVCAATLHDLHLVHLPWFKLQSVRIFSLKASLERFYNDTVSPLTPLYGIQTLVVLWIIAVHTFIVVDFQYFREMQTLKSWASKWPTQIFTNSLFQFDCLILVTAFLFGYNNVGSSTRHVCRRLFKRYLTLSVLILVMMFVTLTLPFWIPPGPLTQDFLSKQTQSCQVDGWRNLLFIQNYFHNECLPSTWIFCVELQLMLLIVPVLSLFHYFSEYSFGRKVFWFALPLLVTVGLLYNFTQVYLNKLPPIYYWTLPDKEQRSEYFNNYYHKPWAHLSVFAIGFYTGVYRRLSNLAEKVIIVESQNATCFGFLVSVCTIMTFTFGFHDWITGELPNEYVSAIYNSCQTGALALAYSWILFYLTNGSKHQSQSPFTRLLCAKWWRTFGKLTCTAYLALPLVQTFLLSSQQQHLYSSNVLMVYTILGNVLFTYMIAFVLILLVEIPTSQTWESLVNYLFSKSGSKEKELQNFKNNQMQVSSDNSAANIELPMCKEKL